MAEAADQEDFYSPDHPRYVSCTTQFNKEAVYHQPKGQVWITTCYVCNKPIHLSYNPNSKKYAQCEGFKHKEHSTE